MDEPLHPERLRKFPSGLTDDLRRAIDNYQATMNMISGPDSLRNEAFVKIPIGQAELLRRNIENLTKSTKKLKEITRVNAKSTNRNNKLSIYLTVAAIFITAFGIIISLQIAHSANITSAGWEEKQLLLMKQQLEQLRQMD